MYSVFRSNNMTKIGNVSEIITSSSALDVFLLVLKSIAMTFIMCGAVVGNLLVIVSVFKFEKLRSMKTNFFIVSLAFADLLVAILVMPFNASMEISGKWVFGRTMCDIFNANDVLFSTASILHLCCISVDRYLAIMHPFKYEVQMTKTRLGIMLATTWISSILISYIPIHSQLYTTKATIQDPDQCLFVVNRLYAAVSSSVSFWIPCTIMVFVYIKIYLTARKQEKHIRSASICSYDSNSNNGDSLLNGRRQSREFSERKRFRREHKAAKTLGIIMGAFILCFLPFFSWYVITSMCREKCPYPPVLGSALFWIGYFNSCLNPIIYAFYNSDFRQAFKRLLHVHKCSKESITIRKYNMADTKNKSMLQLVYLGGARASMPFI